MSLAYLFWNINPEIFRVEGFSLRYHSMLFGLALVALSGFFIRYGIFLTQKLSVSRPVGRGLLFLNG